MARQRFIWPDLWSDPEIGRLPLEAMLAFIGFFSNADDEGRLLADPAYLKGTIFPYQTMTTTKMRNLRNAAVLGCSNLLLYEVDGIEYLAFKRWSQYQKPKFAKASKYPAPSVGPTETPTEAPTEKPAEPLPPERGSDSSTGSGSGSGSGSEERPSFVREVRGVAERTSDFGNLGDSIEAVMAAARKRAES